jgi:serine/threonine-protein kinase
MNESRRALVDRLFDAALELPAERRSAFLDAECRMLDSHCRADVEELLSLAAQPSPLIDSPPLGRALLQAALIEPNPAARESLALGRQVGVWRIVREIGHGGMGSVYLVERADGQFEQKGALKVVRSTLGSGEIADRLRRERRILASLAHANVARLLDGGALEDGRPYFVMEYVEGRPIDRFCDEERLTIDDRLDLFAGVCSGVQHAHRRLVVHRDIKPSNIVVTAEGDVKLLDFGIARLLGPTESHQEAAVTRPISRILTPEYASPEQVRGEPVAIASDVYQLGLLLYELLTGSKGQTVTGTSPSALEQAVCEVAPMRPSARAASAPPAVAATRRLSPSALVRGLAGDLDTIVLCSLRKEPDRRYASVDELLDDVRRYRNRLPVKAQIDSVGYRARKFMQRHRAALAWSAAVLVLASIGVPALTRQRLRTAREAARAQQVENMVAEVFALPNPRVRTQPLTAVHYVDHARTLVLTELQGQPRSQGRLLTRIGRVYNALGHYGKSIEVLEQALVLQRTSFGDDSIEVANTLEWLGQSRHYQGQYQEAEVAVRRALGILRVRLGPGDPDTVRVSLELGDLLHTRGRLRDAEQVLREAVAALRAAALTTRVEDLGQDSLPRGLRDLANVQRDRGRLDESAALYHEAIAIFLGLYGEPNQQVATSRIYFSRLLIMRAEFEAADALLVQAIADLRSIYDGDHALVGMALRQLGYLRIEQKRLPEAEVLLNESQQVLQKWLGSAHPMVPRTRAHQAELALRVGRARDSVSLATQTLAEFDRLEMPEHPSAIDARTTLGEALIALGRPDVAARELGRAVASAERQFVSGDARLSRLRRALAHTTRQRDNGTSSARPPGWSEQIGQ